MPELIDRLSLIDKLDQGQKKALDAKDFTSFYALVLFKTMLQNEPEIHAMNHKTNGDKMLNIDRIRKMSADELASIIKICPCEEKGIECDHASCSDCRIDWLYEEVSEDAGTN